MKMTEELFLFIKSLNIFWMTENAAVYLAPGELRDRECEAVVTRMKDEGYYNFLGQALKDANRDYLTLDETVGLLKEPDFKRIGESMRYVIGLTKPREQKKAVQQARKELSNEYVEVHQELDNLLREIENKKIFEPIVIPYGIDPMFREPTEKERLMSNEELIAKFRKEFEGYDNADGTRYNELDFNRSIGCDYFRMILQRIESQK